MKKYFMTMFIALSFSSMAQQAQTKEQYMKEQNALQNNYMQCIDLQVKKYTSINESADSIAKASVYSCNQYAAKIVTSQFYYKDLSPQDKNYFLSQIQQMGMERAIKSSMDAKLSLKN
ncbi:hypothetical protein [Raoultella ornithinolytica]|uniref:hypothetical protein n=1 Tax=Raoultella ornithinolytica TaxID=54291 RepID=UPI001BD20B61|nr:hypothetical protein [Raoultella ornithinolytica]